MTHQKPIEVVTLGRPFHLGMLYDMRSDSIITGATLWDPQRLANNTNMRKQPYTGYEVITDDSFQNKAHALGVAASLKLSLVGGLIDISGSAKYAHDHQETNHETRLTLKYSTTTDFEQLTMEHLDKGNLNHPDLHDVDLATHVVTGVLYGAEAYFVFDRTVSKNESKSEVHGTLKAMIKKIPKFEIEGEAKLDLNDHENKCLDNLNCKFYGDFGLSENPSTFEEAVKLYRRLPSLLGANNEYAIPKKVWLYPLHLLDNKAMRIVRDISSNLVDYSITVIEELHLLEVRALDLTKSTMFTYFSHMKRHLLDFTARLSELQRDLKEQIALLLPKLRGATGIEESALFDVFKQVDSSPFNKRKLESWLEEKEKEIALTTSFIENLIKDESLNITVKSSSLDDIIGDITYDYILCFSFRFNEENEPQLKDMYNYRYDKDNFKLQRNQQEPTRWFKDRRIISQIRTDLRQFIEFAKTNNIKNGKMKFVVNEEYAVDQDKGAEVILYENGSAKEGFKMPSKPSAPYTKSVTEESIAIEWTDAQSGTEKVRKYKIMYRNYNSETLASINENEREEKWNEAFTNDNKNEICISKLPSKMTFVFKVQSITAIGLSPISDISEPIETLAKKEQMECLEAYDRIRSAPNVSLDQIKIEEVTLQWKKFAPKKSLDSVENSAFLLKQLPPQYFGTITVLFNKCALEGKFFEGAKIAKGIFLSKDGAYPTIDRLRSISLLPNLGKVFERVLVTRIEKWCTDQGAHLDEQSGFTANKRLQTRILGIVEDLRTTIAACNRPAVALFIGISTAFDRLWWPALFRTLEKLAMPIELRKWIFNWLQNR